MDQEFNDIELPPMPPMTDREKLEILYGYLKLFLPSGDTASAASMLSGQCSAYDRSRSS